MDLDLVTVLLEAVALETIFRFFHSHSHSLDLFFILHGDLNLSESMACTIE